MYFCRKYFVLPLSCFLLFSLLYISNVSADSIEEFTPIPKRKAIHLGVNEKKIFNKEQPRQIIEVQDQPVPRRKRDVYSEVNNKENKLIVEEIVSSIRSKLTECWNMPIGATNKKKFSVKINLLLSDQGEVVMADVVDNHSYQKNSLFRAVTDSAMRAVYKCSPFTNLPSEHYHIWREVALDFIAD